MSFQTMLFAALLLGSARSFADEAPRFGGSVGEFVAAAREIPVKSPEPTPPSEPPEKHAGPGGTYYTHRVQLSFIDELGNDRYYVWNPDPLNSGQCATGVEFIAGSRDAQGLWHEIPPAINGGWTKGESVLGNPDVQPGAVIARGWDANGHYPDKRSGNHAAVYLGQSKDGSAIRVYDQYEGRGFAVSTYSDHRDWAVVTTKENSDPKASDSELRSWPPPKKPVRPRSKASSASSKRSAP